MASPDSAGRQRRQRAIRRTTSWWRKAKARQVSSAFFRLRVAAISLVNERSAPIEPFLRSHGRACPGHPRLTGLSLRKKDVDARDKRGHDGGEVMRSH